MIRRKSMNPGTKKGDIILVHKVFNKGKTVEVTKVNPTKITFIEDKQTKFVHHRDYDIIKNKHHDLAVKLGIISESRAHIAQKNQDPDEYKMAPTNKELQDAIYQTYYDTLSILSKSATSLLQDPMIMTISIAF